LCTILNNEKYAKVKIDKHLSSEFKVNKGFRQGDSIVLLLFNVVLKITIRRYTVATQCTIFDKCRQILAYSDDVIIMGRRLQDVKEVLHHWSNKQIRMDLNK